MDNFEVILNESGKIIDFLEGAELEPNPEEFVRQKFIRILHFEYQYPKNYYISNSVRRVIWLSDTAIKQDNTIMKADTLSTLWLGLNWN